MRGAAIAVHPCATIAGVSSHRRARARLLALGAALGVGLLVAGAGALAASASLSQSPPTVGVVALATTTTGPPVTLAQQALAGGATSATSAASAPTTLDTSGIPGSTAVPTTVGTVAPGEFAAFDESLRSGLIGNGALAISVAVAKDGKLLHTAAFGVANPATGEAATPASRFRLASNSKLLTATAILELVEAGQLGLDEPVLARLATRLGVGFKDGRMATVTLRQLLSHTSGMPEYDRTFFGGGAATCEDAARRGLTSGLIGPPGTVYRYSNMNFCLLGLLVEDVTGKPYATVVQDRVLHPLGIEDMRMAGTYDVQPGDVAHPTTPGRTFMEALAGAGAWIGTPTDLVRIVDGLDRSRPGWHPLSAATVEPDAGRPAGRRLPRGPVVRPRPAGVGRRHVGAHGHGRERPLDGHPPPGRHHVGGHGERQHALQHRPHPAVRRPGLRHHRRRRAARHRGAAPGPGSGARTGPHGHRRPCALTLAGRSRGPAIGVWRGSVAAVRRSRARVRGRAVRGAGPGPPSGVWRGSSQRCDDPAPESVGRAAGRARTARCRRSGAALSQGCDDPAPDPVVEPRAAACWQTRPVDPLVALVMGSRSDWSVVEHAATTLDELDVAYDVRVVSAHRTPQLLAELTAWAADVGVEVIVAAAGGAAHLPGMLAANTVLPVLGIPVPSQHLQGLDSLLSIVQMPAGVPVGTMAIGRAGAVNAALLATAIVATRRPGGAGPAAGVAGRADRRRCWPRPIPARRDHRRHPRWRPAGPDAGPGRGAARHPLPRRRPGTRRRRPRPRPRCSPPRSTTRARWPSWPGAATS